MFGPYSPAVGTASRVQGSAADDDLQGHGAGQVPANLADPLIKRGKLRRKPSDQPPNRHPEVPIGGQRSTKGTAMMRLIQLNLNHCTATQDLLVQTVRERRVELALLSEPYRTADNPDWAFDRTKKAAIWRTHSRQRAPVYWWNQEIETARRECLSARRRYQRARGAESFAERKSEYRARRKALKIAIRESKRKCFLDLCDSADSDPWGSAYKVVVKKAYSRTAKLLDPMLRSVAEHLFPVMDGLRPADPATGDHVETNATVSSEEILDLAKLLKDGKAPGPEGIPIWALRLALYLQPDLFAKAFTKCLTE
ncbi:GM16507 [Drosophila sechellia]|uniref:GM16507 n=1 Tax=Drosophila sechellia TaxID=7238 RepID=B4IHZ4_DROSE|nr:GM16507 [Drosophila sechellia]